MEQFLNQIEMMAWFTLSFFSTILLVVFLGIEPTDDLKTVKRKFKEKFCAKTSGHKRQTKREDDKDNK